MLDYPVAESYKAIASGYQRHVTKPLDPEELVQAVVALVLIRNYLVPSLRLGMPVVEAPPPSLAAEPPRAASFPVRD
ncbi:MAG: hypothetical protein V7L05_20920 [Nostoc sp.]|uniref:hypothetical protein n=1 Tax=Nostoc sp. TaxID=1180 RepID=UPI002FFA243B